MNSNLEKLKLAIDLIRSKPYEVTDNKEYSNLMKKLSMLSKEDKIKLLNIAIELGHIPTS